MKKVNYQQVDLTCMFQQVSDIKKDQCLIGVISRKTGGQFKFEETIRKGRKPRNPKLFDGNLISMVRMSNGKYQFHMKTLPNEFDRNQLPFAVYSEVVEALKILE